MTVAGENDSKDPLGAVLGLVSSSAPGASDEEAAEGESAPGLDAETEAFRASASELLAAVEAKDVDAIARALRAACEAHYGREAAESME